MYDEYGLSDEQTRVLEAVAAGRDAIVLGTVGCGKTFTIQAVTKEFGRDRRTLYLTYSRLLKADAQAKVGDAHVQNYHGIVYPHLMRIGEAVGIDESIQRFNQEFERIRPGFPAYDLLVVDEFQDISTEYARLLENIRSVNPSMQVVMVGDMEQKVKSDTSLKVLEFAESFCDDPVMLRFTKSFRMGEEMGRLLGIGWGKDIVGLNPSQKISSGTAMDAIRLIGARDPKDVLVLGKRTATGRSAEFGIGGLLNEVERRYPDKYNKGTVFASIKDGDSSVEASDEVAIFTTYDASKGLERPLVVVMNYDQKYWDGRIRQPNTEPDVLRNVFLVAASRAKEEVFFVRGVGAADDEAFVDEDGEPVDRIGFVPMDEFTTARPQHSTSYAQAFRPSGCFDFKYAEDVDACFQLVTRKRLDDGTGEAIPAPKADGLIDLSPVVGQYQEALFFRDYDPERALWSIDTGIAQAFRLKLEGGERIFTGDRWRDSLLLTAAQTEQMRYAEQVDAEVPASMDAAIVARLSSHLRQDAPTQSEVGEDGHFGKQGWRTEARFLGYTDAVQRGRGGVSAYELKFVSELTRAHFLQAAMYQVLGGFLRTVLWNVRTDERWEVRVQDRRAFMDAVARCVTKGEYSGYSCFGRAGSIAEAHEDEKQRRRDAGR